MRCGFDRLCRIHRIVRPLQVKLTRMARSTSDRSASESRPARRCRRRFDTVAIWSAITLRCFPLELYVRFARIETLDIRGQMGPPGPDSAPYLTHRSQGLR